MNKKRLFDGRYEILQEIPSGRRGGVYLAEDNRLNKRWVLKKITGLNASSEKDVLELFVLKKLKNRLFPFASDIVAGNGSSYVVMEYIEGASLDLFLQEQGKIPVRTSVEWMLTIAEGIGYLHEHGFVYRDLKPQNIIVDKEQQIRIVDFGSVKKTGMKEKAIGTKGFAAPEQYGDKWGNEVLTVDERADIYALGAVFCYICTGTVPGAGSLKRIPGIYRTFVRKCLQQSPDKRYQNMEACLSGLKRRNYQKKIPLLLLIGLILLGGFMVSFRNKSGYEYQAAVQNAENQLVVGNYEEALRYIAKAQKMSKYKEYEAYLCLLKIYEEMGRLEEGLERSRELLDQYGEQMHHIDEIYFQLGMKYMTELGDYEKAGLYFGKITTDKYPEAEHYLELVRLLREFCDEQEVAKWAARFEGYLEEDSTQQMITRDRKVQAYYAAALLKNMYNCNGSGTLERGAALLRTIMDEQKRGYWEERYQIQLMRSYKKAGNYEKAFVCADSLRERFWHDITGDKKDILSETAQLYYEGNEPEKGAVCYEHLLEVSDKDAEVYFSYLLAMCSRNEWQNNERVYEIYSECQQFPELLRDARFEKIVVRIEAAKE